MYSRAPWLYGESISKTSFHAVQLESFSGARHLAASDEETLSVLLVVFSAFYFNEELWFSHSSSLRSVVVWSRAALYSNDQTGFVTAPLAMYCTRSTLDVFHSAQVKKPMAVKVFLSHCGWGGEGVLSHLDFSSQYHVRSWLVCTSKQLFHQSAGTLSQLSQQVSDSRRWFATVLAVLTHIQEWLRSPVDCQIHENCDDLQQYPSTLLDS